VLRRGQQEQAGRRDQCDTQGQGDDETSSRAHFRLLYSTGYPTQRGAIVIPNTRSDCRSASSPVKILPGGAEMWPRLQGWSLRSALLAADLQVVEVRLGVGLGPQANPAGLRDRVVLDVEVLLAVEDALDVVAGHFDLQRVPLLGRDLHLGV